MHAQATGRMPLYVQLYACCNVVRGSCNNLLLHACLQAVRRWYYETQQDAMRGDVKAQALLGQMLAEGYGCEKDLSASKEWIEKSWMRGYRMMGVYCEL